MCALGCSPPAHSSRSRCADTAKCNCWAWNLWAHVCCWPPSLLGGICQSQASLVVAWRTAFRVPEELGATLMAKWQTKVWQSKQNWDWFWKSINGFLSENDSSQNDSYPFGVSFPFLFLLFHFQCIQFPVFVRFPFVSDLLWPLTLSQTAVPWTQGVLLPIEKLLNLGN